MLISKARIEQIVSWLSPSGPAAASGCIVFDECHKAKNLGESKTSEAVISLQERLPMARVLYCSATGVSDVKHMVYASRLNLWGPSTPYPTFAHFQKMLNDRGIGGLEMLSLEMKVRSDELRERLRRGASILCGHSTLNSAIVSYVEQTSPLLCPSQLQGRFISRSLSWDGAVFETCEFKLPTSLEAVYDAACGWWTDVKKGLRFAATRLAALGSAAPKHMMRMYWSALQRFFKEFAVCAKVGFVVDRARRDVEAGMSVIIGLQATGEASTRDFMDLELEAAGEIVRGAKRRCFISSNNATNNCRQL